MRLLLRIEIPQKKIYESETDRNRKEEQKETNLQIMVLQEKEKWKEKKSAEGQTRRYLDNLAHLPIFAVADPTEVSDLSSNE